MKVRLDCGVKGGLFTLLEFLLVLAIIAFLFNFLFSRYFKRPVLDKNTEESLSVQGIDTGSYRSILDSAKDKVQDINQKLIERQKGIEEKY